MNLPIHMHHHNHKAWVVTVDMGYGHQRATYPLKDIAHGGIITANTYSGIPASDRAIWMRNQHFYEVISRFKQVPVIGEMAFNLFDHLQEIEAFYPRRDLSKPTLSVLEVDRMIRGGWGKHLIKKVSKHNLPFVTSFFVTALMADIHGYPGNIYCIICDADFSRSWVAKHPQESRIQYFAPNARVVERLKLYGVPEERIFLTGFPLPKENLGNGQLKTVKLDLLRRFPQIDPKGRYIEQYRKTIRDHLGAFPTKRSTRPFTIMFAVGGAGAQLELAKTIVTSLRAALTEKRLRFILVAGVRKEVQDGFRQHLRALEIEHLFGTSVKIICEKTKEAYFQSFNTMLHDTDVLWTKPSELCFYTALGVPIIMAPPVGSQEKFNKLWLKTLAAGIAQQDPRYTHEWLFDWLESGWLAEAAMQGFLEAPRYGTHNIEAIINLHPEQMKKVRTILQY